ncbi:MAG: hypothetical protein M5U14_02970 [Acidimicrobiia bacterium]|nr:hypothetical protein [Acidimicrobiia bacterium]
MDERRRPTDLHRVRVEQRHADVPDVARPEVHDDAHPVARDEQAPLGADHRLGGVGRTRGEDEGPGRVDVGLDARVGARHRPEVVLEAAAERHRGVARLGRRGGHEQVAGGDREPVGDRGQQALVAGLGDHEPAVGVLHVAQQVLAPARVVEADDGRAGERGTAEGEQVLGDVVEEHGHVPGTSLGEEREEEVGPPARLGDVLAVGPDPLAEPDRRAVADPRVGGVAAQERRRVGRRERCLPGRGHVLAAQRRT